MDHSHWLHVFLTKVNGPLQQLRVQLLHPLTYQSTTQPIAIEVDKGRKLGKGIWLEGNIITIIIVRNLKQQITNLMIMVSLLYDLFLSCHHIPGMNQYLPQH